MGLIWRSTLNKWRLEWLQSPLVLPNFEGRDPEFVSAPTTLRTVSTVSVSWDKQFNSRMYRTGWWFQPLWKILVNWDDYSQYMENKNCSKPPTRYNKVWIKGMEQRYGTDPSNRFGTGIWNGYGISVVPDLVLDLWLAPIRLHINTFTVPMPYSRFDLVHPPGFSGQFPKRFAQNPHFSLQIFL